MVLNNLCDTNIRELITMRAKRITSGKALEMAYSKQTTQITMAGFGDKKIGNKDKPRSNKQADGEVLYKCH